MYFLSSLPMVAKRGPRTLSSAKKVVSWSGAFLIAFPVKVRIVAITLKVDGATSGGYCGPSAGSLAVQ